MTLIYLMKSALGLESYRFIEREKHELNDGTTNEIIAHIAKYIGVTEKEDIEYIRNLVSKPIGEEEDYYRLSVLNIPFEIRIHIVNREKCENSLTGEFKPLQKKNWNIKVTYTLPSEDIKEKLLTVNEIEIFNQELHLREFYNSHSFTKVAHIHDCHRIVYEKISFSPKKVRQAHKKLPKKTSAKIETPIKKTRHTRKKDSNVLSKKNEEMDEPIVVD